MQPGRLARWTVITVIAAAVLAVVGGIVSVALWRPSAGPTAAPGSCPDPPCIGGDGLPGIESLPTVAPVLLLAVAALIGLAALAAAAFAVLTGGRRRLLAIGALAAVSPLLVLVGGEIVPHVVSPCAPALLWGAEAPGICVRSADGLDLPERWHALDHAVVGFLPLSLALLWSWRRITRPSDQEGSAPPAVPSQAGSSGC